MVITFVHRAAKLFWFALLCYSGARFTDPAEFISLETTQRFAKWAEGSVNQENFDDLWVLIWVMFSLMFAVAGYIATMQILRKLRR